jgi:hypothetical protein
MNPFEYIESVKERLSTDSIVLGFDISREFSNLNEAFIRVRANLITHLSVIFNHPLLISGAAGGA